MSRLFAVVAGAGSGTGRSIALRLHKASYSVVVIARSESSYKPIVDEINALSTPHKAIGISADASDRASVQAAFKKIKEELPDHKLAAAFYNSGGGFAFKPFLEADLKDIESSLNVAATGLFNFAQQTLPLLLESVDSSPLPPSLIVTGATASLKGSAKFGTFAAGKFAQRALTQSLAREFGPQGVHVALAVIDGVIDTPWGKDRVANQGKEDGKINPDAIAESFYQLHAQHRSSWSQEIDLRPYIEKF